MGDGEFGF